MSNIVTPLAKPPKHNNLMMASQHRKSMQLEPLSKITTGKNDLAHLNATDEV